MILIQERIAKHVPGLTSLFIKSDYNQTLLDTVRKIEQANYDKKTQEWEISLLDLAFLLNNIAGIDDITLELIKDEGKIEHFCGLIISDASSAWVKELCDKLCKSH